MYLSCFESLRITTKITGAVMDMEKERLMEKPEDSQASCASACSTAPVTSMSNDNINDWFDYLEHMMATRYVTVQPLCNDTLKAIANLRRLALLGNEIAEQREYDMSEQVAKSLERLAQTVRSDDRFLSR